MTAFVRLEASTVLIAASSVTGEVVESVRVTFIASVALTVVLVGSRNVVASASGEAAVPVAEGNFSQAFTSAFSDALIASIRSLDVK